MKTGKGPFGMRVEDTMDPKGNRRFLLDMLPKNSIGVEIGVAIGNFSSAILQVVEPRRLYLVDPWEHDASSDAANRFYGGGKGQDGMNLVAKFVANRFADKKNVEIRRKRSDEFLVETTPNFFDWIYIDGDHTFGPCLADILLSIRKVKLGGIICGDDWDWGAEHGLPVNLAVKCINNHEKRLQIVKFGRNQKSISKNGQWMFRRVK